MRSINIKATPLRCFKFIENSLSSTDWIAFPPHPVRFPCWPCTLYRTGTALGANIQLEDALLATPPLPVCLQLQQYRQSYLPAFAPVQCTHWPSCTLYSIMYTHLTSKDEKNIFTLLPSSGERNWGSRYK